MIRRTSIVIRKAGWSVDHDGHDAIEPTDNISISHAHTPSSRIVIERADRWDLLFALMEAQGVDPDIIQIVDPSPSPSHPSERVWRPLLLDALALLDVPEHAQDADWYAARDEIAEACGLSRIGTGDDYDRAVRERAQRKG